MCDEGIAELDGMVNGGFIQAQRLYDGILNVLGERNAGYSLDHEAENRIANVRVDWSRERSICRIFSTPVREEV